MPTSVAVTERTGRIFGYDLRDHSDGMWCDKGPLAATLVGVVNGPPIRSGV